MKPGSYGFTIIEALVASVIFSIAVAGIFATTGSIRQPTAENDHSLEAAYIGQQVLEDMRRYVDAGTWNNPALNINRLKVGAGHDCCMDPPACAQMRTVTKNNITYTCTYTVTQEASGARKVKVDVGW